MPCVAEPGREVLGSNPNANPEKVAERRSEVSEETVRLRERIVKYAAAGYRRRDIAHLCGITTDCLRRHLVALGIVDVVARREVREEHRGIGRHRVVNQQYKAHNGPREGFENAEVEL